MNTKEPLFTIPPVEIPREKLSRETIDGIIEEFVLREGTDYGAQEISLERKKEQVYKQLEKNEVKIFFDPHSESVTLMAARQFLRA